ncbi:hypothetical protein MANES_05G171801v8 [Manihot esculenta]|uniref:Uncharacterized protein n=1 Tax=Manihot esculenta TaxID=3983 RepID=A0ACB7HPV2_MANES|nr:hypothetical protein MANES_05G171801v8 [Manihot esculenta]
MEKMMLLRSIIGAACFRSPRFAAIFHHQLRHHLASRFIFTLSSPSFAAPSNRIPSDFRSSLAMAIGRVRYFSEDVTHIPVIQDPEIRNVFKDLMVASWYELYDNVKKALSKNTYDKAGQEVLKNVFRAAEAVEEFGGTLISMKMELDDSIGLNDFANALRTVYQRYSAYLDAFGPDEGYLRKKAETELGSKMIYLKMRCSGLGSEWGKGLQTERRAKFRR